MVFPVWSPTAVLTVPVLLNFGNREGQNNRAVSRSNHCATLNGWLKCHVVNELENYCWTGVSEKIGCAMALTGSLMRYLQGLFWIVCLLSAVSTARTRESRPGEKEKLGGSLKPLDKDDGSAQLQSVPVIEPPQPAQKQPNKDLSSSESSSDIEASEDESSPVPAKHPRGQKRPQQQPKKRLPSQERSDDSAQSSNEPAF